MLFRWLVFLLVLASLADEQSWAADAGRSASARPPSSMNVLMIGIEDWSTAAIGAYGAPIAKTPHVDSLASRSIQFNRAYCQSPVCNPSRASMCTGLRPDSTRVYANSDEMDATAPEDLPFLAGVLGQKRDAWTATIGKLVHHDFEGKRFLDQFDQVEMPETIGHLGEEVTYDAQTIGYEPAMPRGEKPRSWEFSPQPEVEATLQRLRAERDAILATGVRSTWEIRKPFQSLEAEVVGDSGDYPEQQHDGQIASVASQMLADYASDGRQFFLHVGFYAPHTPLRAPEKFIQMYDWRTMPTTPATIAQDRDVPEVARRFGKNYDIFNQYEQTDENCQKAIASYYACSSYVDWCIGQVLNSLKEQGLAKNTIVVLYSDHGYQLGEHGMWSKYCLFEQSTRVPLLVCIPGVTEQGVVCDEIVELVDLLPTLADLWDLPTPEPCEGISFRPLLSDPSRAWKKAAFSMIPLGGLGRTVRTRDFKYAEYRGGKPSPEIGEPDAIELYDLRSDPWEQNNLASSEEHQDVLQEHAQLLRAGWKAALP